MSSSSIVQTVLWCLMLGLWYGPVLVAGIAVFVVWRRAVWTGPYCRKCRYDLRGRRTETTSCPECGADLTNQKNLCRVAYRKSWLGITAGILVLIGPGIGLAGAYAYYQYVNPHPVNLSRNQSNAQLIQQVGITPEDSKIERCLVRPQKQKQKLLVKFKVGDSLDIPISFDTYVRFGEREEKLGDGYYAFRHGETPTRHGVLPDV